MFVGIDTLEPPPLAPKAGQPRTRTLPEPAIPGSPITVPLKDYLGGNRSVFPEDVIIPDERASDVAAILKDAPEEKKDVAAKIGDFIQEQKETRGIKKNARAAIILDFRGIESIVPQFVNRLATISRMTSSNFVIVGAEEKIKDIFKNLTIDIMTVNAKTPRSVYGEGMFRFAVEMNDARQYLAQPVRPEMGI